MSNIRSDIDIIISSLGPSGKFNVIHRLISLASDIIYSMSWKIKRFNNKQSFQKKSTLL